MRRSSWRLALVLPGMWLAACGRLGFDVHCVGQPECQDTHAITGKDGGSEPDGDGVPGDGDRDGSEPCPGCTDGSGDGDGDADGDGDVDGGGEASPDGGVDAHGLGCGSMQLLQENFTNSGMEQYWTAAASDGAQAVRADDRVELQLPAGSQPTTYAKFTTQAAFDLRGSELALSVGRVGGRYTALELRDELAAESPVGVGRGVALGVENGVLNAFTLEGDQSTSRASIPYDAAAQRYWRIREAAGRVHWETSSDRQSWSALHAEAVAMDTRRAWVTLLARSQLSAASAAWFDDINLPAAQVPGFCSASSLGDDFDDGTVSSQWIPVHTTSACTVREMNGHGELRYTGAYAYCAFLSADMFDLRGAAVSFELVSVPTDARFQTSIFLTRSASGNQVKVEILNGTATLKMLRDDDTVFQQTLEFDATAQRFWRFRESAGTTYWETSPDGAAWQQQGAHQTEFEATALHFSMGGTVLTSGTASAQVLRFDSLNR
jgi:hypothetical protein